MTYLKRTGLRFALAYFICGAASAFAQTQTAISDDLVKIGILTDMSGVYSEVGGRGSVIAAEMAIEDFGGTLDGKPVTLVSADHQNRADVGSLTVRKWFDVDQVDVVIGMNNSSVALAAVEVARAANKIVINTGAGATALTNEQCAPTSIHYTYDTYALAHGTARSVVQHGGDSWYFLTADYSFGKALEKDVSEVVKKSGGAVLGAVRHPLNSSDFSSFMLSAQSSGAKIVGLANAGADTVNAIRTAHEFGLTKTQKLAGLLVFIQDIHSLGIDVAQGMYITTGFYWDRDEETRAWSKRFFERAKTMPSMIHAGVYSATRNYLKAVQAVRSDATDMVMKHLKSTPVDDFFSHGGMIRSDGRFIHDMYLVQVKSPEESKAPWDYYKLITTIPQSEAFKPLEQSTCPLVKK